MQAFSGIFRGCVLEIRAYPALQMPLTAMGRRSTLNLGVQSGVPDVNTVTPARIKAARAVAIGADFLQIALFPLFAEGFVSVLDDALDVAVCLTVTKLVGWHYSFLPSFIVKVVPFADLVPTWTIAVFLATRQSAIAPEPGITEVYAERALPPRLPEGRSGDKP